MIPAVSIKRLCRLYSILLELEKAGESLVTSRELEAVSGYAAHSIRKDISFLGVSGPGGGKYRVEALSRLIGGLLLARRKPRVALVGLGRSGMLLLDLLPRDGEFCLVAGFDSDINLVEVTETDIELFPSYMIPDKVREMKIEMAVLAVAPNEVARSIKRLVDGGIRGILNYTPVAISSEHGLVVRNMHPVEELRILSVELAVGE